MRSLKIVVSLLCACPLNLFGQDTVLHTMEKRMQVLLGAEFAVVNPLSFEKAKVDATKGPEFVLPIQFSTGLNVCFGVRNGLNCFTHLKTGILTDCLNTNILLTRSTDAGDVESLEMLLRKQYVGLPVLLGHSAQVNDRFSIVFRIGVVVMWNIGNKLSHGAIGNWEQTLADWRLNCDKEKGRNATMLYLSYGHEWRLNDVLQLQYELYWQHRFNEQFFFNTETQMLFRPYDILGINIGIGWMPKWFN